MLHYHILLVGFICLMSYVIYTFKRIHGTGKNADERLLSVFFGVSLFGAVCSGIKTQIGNHEGISGLMTTSLFWLVIVAGLLACKHINDNQIGQRGK